MIGVAAGRKHPSPQGKVAALRRAGNIHPLRGRWRRCGGQGQILPLRRRTIGAAAGRKHPSPEGKVAAKPPEGVVFVGEAADCGGVSLRVGEEPPAERKR
jgi:hypothetical protein